MSPIATDTQYAARLITPKHAGADGEPQAVQPVKHAAEHDLPLQADRKLTEAVMNTAAESHIAAGRSPRERGATTDPEGAAEEGGGASVLLKRARRASLVVEHRLHGAHALGERVLGGHLALRRRLVDHLRKHLCHVVARLIRRHAGLLRHLAQRRRVHALLYIGAADRLVVAVAYPGLDLLAHAAAAQLRRDSLEPAARADQLLDGSHSGFLSLLAAELRQSVLNSHLSPHERKSLLTGGGAPPNPLRSHPGNGYPSLSTLVTSADVLDATRCGPGRTVERQVAPHEHAGAGLARLPGAEAVPGGRRQRNAACGMAVVIA
jgi:hypothetical protein